MSDWPFRVDPEIVVGYLVLPGYLDMYGGYSYVCQFRVDPEMVVRFLVLLGYLEMHGGCMSGHPGLILRW